MNKDAEVTLGEVLQWYETRPGRHPGTQRAVKYQIAKLRKAMPVKTTIKDMPRDTLERFAEQFGDLSPTTLNLHMTRFKAAINEAYRAGLIESKPCDHSRAPTPSDSRQRIATDDEFIALVDAARWPIRQMIETAFFLPVRAGDLIKMTWELVDLKEGILTLPGRLNKTVRDRRVVLHPSVKEMLLGLPTRPRGGAVFVKSTGEAYKKFPFDQFSAVRDSIGIEDLTWHDFKHTAVSNLVMAGTPEFLIRIQSGNKGTDSLHIYTNATNAMLAEGTKMHPDPRKSVRKENFAVQ